MQERMCFWSLVERGARFMKVIFRSGRIVLCTRTSQLDEIVPTDELKPLEDQAALVEGWWLSPGPFRAADRFSLRNIATPPFGFPPPDIHRSCREFFVRT